MIENFFTVGQQVLQLFILIATGFLCGKIKILDEKSVKSITNLILYIICPCVIVETFMRPFDTEMMQGMLITAAAALGIHLITIIIAKAVFHDKDERRNRVYKFGLIFSNCGYMSLPLQQALLGADGVFFGAVYIVIFNIIVWTYGVYLSSGDKKSLSPKKVLLNPTIIAVFAGLVIFLLSLPVHPIISKPIGYLAALNTPVPMLIIGFYLSQSEIADAFKNGKAYICVGLRLVIIPLMSLAILMLCGIRGTILITCVIASGAPVSAATTMFAAKFENDTELSVNIVTLSTLFSVASLPLIVGFAQTIGG